MRPTGMRSSALPLAVVLVLLSFCVFANTYVVAPPGTLPPPNFNTIQEAIDFVVDGDVIIVEPGTYVENIDFLGKAITVQSTAGADVTIIDGSACTTGPDTCSVVTFATGEGPDSVLDGLTVTGGQGTVGLGGGVLCESASPTILNCTISGNMAVGYNGYAAGGGITNTLNSSPTFTNCTISGNDAGNFLDYGYGGGMVNSFSSSPTLTNCTISGNTARGGGGVDNYGASAVLTDCTLSGNLAYLGGGIEDLFSSTLMVDCAITENVASFGAGVKTNFSSSTLTNCTISSNAGDYGGGMWNYGSAPALIDCTITTNTAILAAGIGNTVGSWPTLTNCTISENTATVGVGGGMSSRLGSSPTLTSCTISGNTAALRGGGIHNYDNSSPTLTNCTVSGNTAGLFGGGMWSEALNGAPSFPIVTNSIFWENSPSEIESEPGSGATVTFSNVQGGYPGTGNIDADPLFVDASGGNFHLVTCSPAIDAGDNAAPNLPATDFEGDPRIDNGTVDMGVDEVVGGPGPCPPFFIRGDCDFDLVINPLVDALFLLNFGFQGGQDPPCLDACDANDDGVFNALVDGVYILTFGFVMGDPPPAPYPLCGSDPTPDDVSCDDFTGCP